jgi:magnesium transporter
MKGDTRVEDHTLLEDVVITKANVSYYTLLINECSPVDIAALMVSKPVAEQLLIYNAMTEANAVSVFEYLPLKAQIKILHGLSSTRVTNLLNALAPDDRTAFLEGLSCESSTQLLKALSPQERELSTRLLGYPESSVGRLMTTDYVAAKLDWTIQAVLDYIREHGHDSETINVIYAIDDNGVLLDDFRIRQLLLASLDCKLSDIADYKFVALNALESEEEAVRQFRKYARTALPVVDTQNVLLGIVTVDDIMAVAVAEDTQDFQMIGGVSALNESYMNVSLDTLIQKRAGWLVILFIGELFTASAMGYFEGEIAQAVVLALFLPLIISSGGNAGSQASSLIVRALALGEVGWKDWWTVMRREVISGLALGGILGIIGFIRVCIWTLFSNIYGPHWLLIAFTIACSLIAVVLLGTLSGAIMPMLLKRLGFDPAAASAPMVATFIDVSGIILYFTIALAILKGTLL